MRHYLKPGDPITVVILTETESNGPDGFAIDESQIDLDTPQVFHNGELIPCEWDEKKGYFWNDGQ